MAPPWLLLAVRLEPRSYRRVSVLRLRGRPRQPAGRATSRRRSHDVATDDTTSAGHTAKADTDSAFLGPREVVRLRELALRHALAFLETVDWNDDQSERDAADLMHELDTVLAAGNQQERIDYPREFNELLSGLGLGDGATISTVQRRLHVNAPDAMRLLSLRALVASVLAAGGESPPTACVHCKGPHPIICNRCYGYVAYGINSVRGLRASEGGEPSPNLDEVGLAAPEGSIRGADGRELFTAPGSGATKAGV